MTDKKKITIIDQDGWMTIKVGEEQIWDDHRPSRALDLQYLFEAVGLEAEVIHDLDNEEY